MTSPRPRSSTTRTALLIGATAIVTAGAATAVAAASTPDRTKQARQAIQGGKAKNVIMFLGDGMGDSEITIARNYAVGANGRLAMDTLPLTGEYTTYAVQQGSRTAPNYVTDSAASGTGWATGHKTYNGAISVDPVTGKALPTILELAQEKGFATGDITTAELTDATPAVQVSHVTDRSCEGPQDMAACPTNTIENGGRGSIAEQSVNHGFDVLLGGSTHDYGETVTAGRFAGLTVTQQAQVNGYQVVTDAAGMQAASARHRCWACSPKATWIWSTRPTSLRPTRRTPRPPRAPPTRRYPATEPHLTEMTRKAIDLLQAKANRNDNGKGFFLQVEGASIDKQDHAENVCGQIGETVEFDTSIRIALNYAKSPPGHADRGHRRPRPHQPDHRIPADSHRPQPRRHRHAVDRRRRSRWSSTTRRTSHGQSQDHTGTEVRIAAQGPQAANVLGITNQTDLFHTYARAIGVE